MSDFIRLPRIIHRKSMMGDRGGYIFALYLVLSDSIFVSKS